MEINQEKIIGIVDGLELYNFVGLIRYIAVFTNQRIIFVKATDTSVGKFFLQGSMVNQTQSKLKEEEELGIIEKISPIEIVNKYETMLISVSEAENLKLTSLPAPLRSKIKYKSSEKKFKFNLKKKTYKKFLELHSALISGDWQKHSDEHNVNIERKITESQILTDGKLAQKKLRALAVIILFLVAIPVLFGHGIRVKDLLLVIPIFLLFQLKKQAIVLLAVFTAFYFLSTIGIAIQTYGQYLTSPSIFWPEYFATLILLAISLYLWFYRKILFVQTIK